MSPAPSAETAASGAPASVRTVAMTGATGLVGTALTVRLQRAGTQVLSIRRGQSAPGQTMLQWDPYSGLSDPQRLAEVDAVVHLAGENIAAGRWNKRQKQRIRDSRVIGTRNLVQSLSRVARRPATLICASAVGFYGERGDTVLDESASAGTGFLADLCQAWEAEAMAAEQLGLRVVCVRIGVVLSPAGGALAKMLLPFRLCAGGVIGSGRQYWSWIGLHDLVTVFQFCLNNAALRGPVNAVSPNPLTNREFTRTLAQVLHRPAIFPMPAFVARLALGEMADALLLASTRVIPAQLSKLGFSFEHPELNQCLEHELHAK